MNLWGKDEKAMSFGISGLWLAISGRLQFWFVLLVCEEVWGEGGWSHTPVVCITSFHSAKLYCLSYSNFLTLSLLNSYLFGFLWEISEIPFEKEKPCLIEWYFLSSSFWIINNLNNLIYSSSFLFDYFFNWKNKIYLDFSVQAGKFIKK